MIKIEKDLTINHFVKSNMAAKQVLRNSQREQILKLLHKNNFVRTSHLRIIAYQYNARIYELRRGIHNNKLYDIRACREEGIHGFKLLGWR